MMPLRFLLPVAITLLLGACQTVHRPTPPDAPTAQPAAPSQPSKPPASAPKPPETPETPPAPVAPVPLKELLGADIFARLTARFADAPCVKDRVVQRWERTYARWPPRFASQIEAVLPLMEVALEDVEAHHLPGEFVLLPIVESWYRPDAGSPRNAYGMWQFTTATAKNQGLRIVPGFDERLAPQAATRAAMRYLAILQNHFGDWKLADMAFNAGEYRLMRSLGKAKPEQKRAVAEAHLPPGLSMTTYEHLAKVQALACLIAQPKRFGIELPVAARVEPLQVVALPAGISSLDSVAQRADIDAGALRKLNPAFLQGRIVSGARREILLPRAAAARLRASAQPAVTAKAEPSAKPAPPRQYRVKRGDTLGAIAQRHRVRLRDILRWNGLDVRALLHPGQVLQLEP
jgi:membrane-bound lytic murein transglycosylase D